MVCRPRGKLIGSIDCDLNFRFRDVTAGCFREAALDSISEIGRPNVKHVTVVREVMRMGNRVVWQRKYVLYANRHKNQNLVSSLACTFIIYTAVAET